MQVEYFSEYLNLVTRVFDGKGTFKAEVHGAAW